MLATSINQRSLSSLLNREPVRIQDGVRDFIVEAEADYCRNFGEQWNRFRDIQIDSLSGKSESHARFFAETGWTAEDIKGKLLLDAGCGAGRFAEVAMDCGARVVAVDISEAAWACKKTLERFPEKDYLVIRASLFDLPFKKESFDAIYSLGVLQHTPDPLRALSCLTSFLAPGGRLATWIYERRAFDISLFQPRTWIRRAVASRSTESKLKLSRFLTATAFPVGWGLSWFGRTGERASQFLPYAARHHLGRGNLRRQWDYSVMDTFDWYGPLYDQPQSEAEVIRTMKEAGLIYVRRLPARGMAIVGEAPRTAP
jgi:SAM-dependent methyltransferase